MSSRINPTNAVDASENLDPMEALGRRFSSAIARAFSDAPSASAADPLITPSKNPQFGEFQSNAAMGLSKIVSLPPREVAERIVSNLHADDIALPITKASIAGPGFINIVLRPDALARMLAALDTPELGIPRPPEHDRQTVVVDLCGVNLAKQMHVGHLRSIIIGDAIARTLERLGHRVIRQNHVGDWGLPIAMVVDKLMKLQAQGRDAAGLSLDEIEKLYRAAQADCAADEAGLAAARRWWGHPKALRELQAQVEGAREALASAKATLVNLQTGDKQTLEVWRRIADATMQECLAICDRLGAAVLAEHSAGESAYAAELAELVDDLLSRRVAVIDQGAVVIRVEGLEEPCIIRKSGPESEPTGIQETAAGDGKKVNGEKGDKGDKGEKKGGGAGGGFLYATTDLAAIRRRVKQFHASRIIYCVDARQSLHFKLVFGAAAKAGFTNLNSAPASLEHAAFGAILGPDNKPFKTRTGENVKLSSLLDEAAARALQAVNAKNPDLPRDEARLIAETVGVAAIKYADLSNDRVKDYVFSFDRMLAFEGNAGPYLLFALARIRSIFRKAAEQGIAVNRCDSAAFDVRERDEKNLALALLRYPGVVRAVAQTLEPHRLCQYLYELSTAFSAFFTNCHVLNAPDDDARLSRLRLCRLTERVLQDGLTLLGVRTLERM